MQTIPDGLASLELWIGSFLALCVSLWASASITAQSSTAAASTAQFHISAQDHGLFMRLQIQGSSGMSTVTILAEDVFTLDLFYNECRGRALLGCFCSMLHLQRALRSDSTPWRTSTSVLTRMFVGRELRFCHQWKGHHRSSSPQKSLVLLIGTASESLRFRLLDRVKVPLSSFGPPKRIFLLNGYRSAHKSPWIWSRMAQGSEDPLQL